MIYKSGETIPFHFFLYTNLIFIPMNDLYYQDSISGGKEIPGEDARKDYLHYSQKENWRIVRLTNGYYQTEVTMRNCQEQSWQDVTRRKTIEEAEQAIDCSIKHFSKKVDKNNTPNVVKTF